MDTMSEARLHTRQRSSYRGQENSLWSSGFGTKLEAVTPFLGKYRPFVGRCCQTCTPKSWVLQQMPSPAGPRLQLSPAFASRDSQERLEQFIRQFICS
ncbi:glycerol-3-phosphate acyltransferase 2, mitochondrial-like [Tupaia chinensis]|uniref:glycerol-3-phosphate acyltransferase 2, mitochondrial-like n=1 Tax=Tupaia chinensis TaxID=246437 RepID=UPI0003C8EF41|nr:glycerol-3-phosphate acyltransferase 2, mitochondrial-like [Tupaia chinensis]